MLKENNQNPWRKYNLTIEEKGELLKYTDTEIEKLMEERSKKQDELDKDGVDGHRYFNALKNYSQSVHELKTEVQLILSGVEFRKANWVSNTYEIKNPSKAWQIFIYHVGGGKWRIQGKNKYYYSKSIEQFLQKYVLGDN
jgi:hypothetical protein